MPLKEPEAGYVWLHVTGKEATDVVVVGEVYSWSSHWTGVPGARLRQAVRCLRDESGDCAWCEAGLGHQVRYVFPVRVDGQLRLVELGRVQYPMLRLCYQEGPWVGRRLRLVKQWNAKNAPIEVRPVGRDHVSVEDQVDIEEFVEQLGLGQLRLLPVPQSNPPSKRLPVSGEAASAARQGVRGEAAPPAPPPGYVARPKGP